MTSKTLSISAKSSCQRKSRAGATRLKILTCLRRIRRRGGVNEKAAVVLGIRKSLITREQAYEMYRLSAEELASWEDAFDRGGYQALALKARGAAR